MGELMMKSYTVLQSDEAFDMYTEASRRNLPLELDLLGEGEACRISFRPNTIIHDVDDWRILGKLDDGRLVNIIMGRHADGTPYADRAIIARRPHRRPEELREGLG